MDDDLTELFLLAAGIIGGVFVVLWWIVRPFSFTYRIEGNDLVVRTFFILPHARIPLDRIRNYSRESPEKGKAAVRVLAPPYDLLGRKRCYAETDREILALPRWHLLWLGSARSPADFELARVHKWDFLSVLKSPKAVPLDGEIPAWIVTGAHFLAFLVHWIRRYGLLIATDMMILIPLGLTACELAGADIMARNYSLALVQSLQFIGYPHFAASAFVLLCGICLRVVLAKDLPVPRLLAAAAILSAIGHFSIGPEGTHDLSHMMFDSCEGYSDLLVSTGLAILVAAIVVLIEACGPRPSPPQLCGSRADAATP